MMTWKSHVTLIVVLAALAVVAVAQPTGTTAERLAVIDALIGEAKDLGGDKRCPVFYDAARKARDAAANMIEGDPPDGSGRADPALTEARFHAERLLARARFIRELRNERYGWEEAAASYDRLVDSIATIAGLDLDPVLTGPDAGRRLVDALDRRLRDTRAHVDSLRTVNRGQQLWIDAERAARDSTIVELRAEVTGLRHRLWEMELRAGVAEADRSAAEDQVRRAREREELVQGLGALFAEDEGEVVLTPEGDIHVRLTGLKFASGSAWLNPKYDPLLDKLSDVIAKFPQAPVQVEGHTDDSGPRSGNLSLSESRARAVAGALAEKLGRPADAFTVIGRGPDRPVAANSTPAGRARNRRIEVLVRAGEVE
ncbi:OmpA family protein [bacterium]|nr:OmpA family protein [bacterium]